MFKVFNQGGRLFTYHELRLEAGKFTNIPDQHVEGVTKLLEKYPTELVSADVAEGNASRLSRTVTELQTRLADKDTEIERLKAGENPEIIKALTERAEAAELGLANIAKDVRATVDRIHELERLVAQRDDLLKAARNEVADAHKQIASLTVDLDKATAPTPTTTTKK